MNQMVFSKTILLVEDDPNDVEFILSALSELRLSNNIEVTHDGEEALDYLFRRNRFNSRLEGNPIVIFLDIKMPKLDGIETLKEIKNAPQFSSIPVVILTSSRESRDLEKCYELGANSYVVKPINFLSSSMPLKKLVYFGHLSMNPQKVNFHSSKIMLTNCGLQPFYLYEELHHGKNNTFLILKMTLWMMIDQPDIEISGLEF
jgi:CheY-like chemotaxis protein